MKKIGLIALLTFLVGTGSVVWAERGIKVTEKSGNETTIKVSDIKNVVFLSDHEGNKTGVKIVDKEGNETFYEMSSISGLHYLHDYQIEDQTPGDEHPEQPGEGTVLGEIRSYDSGFTVVYPSEYVRETGEITVTGSGNIGDLTPEVVFHDKAISVYLEGYPAGTYNVSVPAGLVTIGNIERNKGFTQEVVVPETKNPYKWTVGRDSQDEGVKLIACIETNDVNPANLQRYKLKYQKKALWDYVVLFSGNINYGISQYPPFFPDTHPHDDPHFFANDGITYILKNYDEIIKPLKDMGSKVIMGVLNNHDVAGIAKLNSDGIEAFVNDLYELHTNYGIDGFFWDDEYSAGGSGTGVSSQATPANFVKLLEAVKTAMPDAINIVFAYGSISSLNAGGNTDLSDIIDGVIPNYGSWITDADFPGLGKLQMGYSYEASNNRSSWYRADIAKEGYGYRMIFAPGRSGFEEVMDKNSLELAQKYYGDELDESLCDGYGGAWIPKKW